MHRIAAKASWWDDAEEGESLAHEQIDIKLGYEGDTLYIDGLNDGRYLSISLKSVAEAIAEGVHKE
jgi:hypothetical protein